MFMSCKTCDWALVHSDGVPPHDIAVKATNDRLISLVDAGLMQYIRGDVPLQDMLDLAYSEMRYTIVSYLKCESCGRTRFWGLCIRGAPIYKVVKESDPDRWNWEAVPPRELWARS
ncbi:hypothetical protein ITJ38_04850 [Agreia pratensis]|nr:hypothetical protein [Agreia pratensis]